MKVAVSYLKSDNKKECIKKLDTSICDFIHVDLCDGKYVEDKNFTISEVINLLSKTSKMLDIHLMCVDPIKYVMDLAILNVDTITIHPLACKDAISTLNEIKNLGIKAGIAINPDEELATFNDLYGLVDRVLIMSVVPGKGGQAFIEDVLTKIDELNTLKEKYHFETSVDGGINDQTIIFLKDKDIDVIVSGSYITSSLDYNDSIKTLKA